MPGKNVFRPYITLDDGHTISVQANTFTYCKPQGPQGPWTHVECGYPSFHPSLKFRKYAEDPDGLTRTVYPYVPVEVLEREIALHGGALDLAGKIIDPNNYWWRIFEA